MCTVRNYFASTPLIIFLCAGEAEASAMLDACSRLHESPCKWVACDAVLNSVENLVTHLHNVHAQEDKEMPVSITTQVWNECAH